jgi:hypothetical protein
MTAPLVVGYDGTPGADRPGEGSRRSRSGSARR